MRKLLSSALVIGFLTFGSVYVSTNVQAQQLTSPDAAGTMGNNSSDPLEITADGTLEWHRDANKFIATKNAIAKQGEVSLAGEKLTALYRSVAGNNFDLHTIQAEDDVRIQSRDTVAHGDKADYDIIKGYAEMTGSDLRLISPDQTVTAQDKFEYWTEDGRLIAIGNAKITRRNERGEINTLQADRLTAFMKDNAQGQRVLERLEADGNVIITTPTETLTGNRGVYLASTNIAEITGNVTIRRGPNVLEGTKADVNLNTNISRMFGGGDALTRVRGVFYPSSR
ncbi:MAG: LptA/OstA family protein [Alphaproteobacteria bacterium]